MIDTVPPCYGSAPPPVFSAEYFEEEIICYIIDGVHLDDATTRKLIMADVIPNYQAWIMGSNPLEHCFLQRRSSYNRILSDDWIRA
jgi:hypothetical protein